MTQPKLPLSALEAWARYDGAAGHWVLPRLAVEAFQSAAEIGVDDLGELLRRRGWRASSYSDAFIRDRGF